MYVQNEHGASIQRCWARGDRDTLKEIEHVIQCVSASYFILKIDKENIQHKNRSLQFVKIESPTSHFLIDNSTIHCTNAGRGRFCSSTLGSSSIMLNFKPTA